MTKIIQIYNNGSLVRSDDGTYANGDIDMFRIDMSFERAYELIAEDRFYGEGAIPAYFVSFDIHSFLKDDEAIKELDWFKNNDYKEM